MQIHGLFCAPQILERIMTPPLGDAGRIRRMTLKRLCPLDRRYDNISICIFLPVYLVLYMGQFAF